MFKDSIDRTEVSRSDQGAKDAARQIQTILIVEDYDKIRALLSRHFERSGARVYSATRIVDALALTHSVIPDVVIIDYDLEKDEPITAIKKVHQVVPGAKILVFGGHENDTIRTSIVNAGASDFIPNGYDLSQLDTLIRSI